MTVSRVHFDKQKYIKTTLEELKTLSNYEIEMLLEKITILSKKDNLLIYPIYKRIKSEDGALVTIEKEFERKDGRTVANTIISKMFSFLYDESVFLGNISSDMLEVCDTLKAIQNDGNEEYKNKILQNLDLKYSFLLQVDVYDEIYKEFRQDYISLLEKSIRHNYSKAKLDEEYQKEYSLYVELPQNTYRRAIQKHRKNKPNKY